MTRLQTLWARFLADFSPDTARPDYDFDLAFYGAQYPDLALHGINPAHHYANHGKAEGRLGTLYQQVVQNSPDLDARIAKLTIDPDLSAAIAEEVPGACELAFELMALGSPLDGKISDFSCAYYLEIYPDIAKAGLNPLLHFIQHGISEGRRSLLDIRKNEYAGGQVFDPDKPTCMICVHDCSKSGAPVVGLDLVREAADSHNIVVMALRGGVLLEQFRAAACVVMISERPAEDMVYFAHPALKKIDFAILNSVECFLFTKALVSLDIPFASYLHEYTEYTFPAYKSIFTALFSDLLVFSSNPVRETWGHTFDDLNFDVARDSIIIPQRSLRLGSVPATMHQSARARLAQLIGRDLDGKRVVIGAGHVQWRKGTDLFVMTAQVLQQPDPDTIFVWIGDGLNHEDVYFGVWLDKHMREAGANKPHSNLYFLPAGPYYHDVCRAADVMFLSSRLDPLPNVVFDAMHFGTPVVLFQGATGFDDETYCDQPGLVSVAYGNLQAAAQALHSVPLKQPATPEDASKEADKGEGPSVFAQITQALFDRLRAQRHFVAGAGEYDTPVLFGITDDDAQNRIREREKMWSYNRRLVWSSRAAAQAEIDASDNWYHHGMNIRPYSSTAKYADLPDFSVHIHAYYIDDLEKDLNNYALYQHAKRIIVTTDSLEKGQEISAIFETVGLQADIITGSNTGRDILPFLKLFSEGPAQDDPADALWCHVHQKKSVGTAADGDVWRTFLMNILLGSKDTLSCALDMIAAADIGLVSPFDPYQISWNASRRLLDEFEPQMPGAFPKQPILFPVGNMFWTKAGVVAQMNAFFGNEYPWPNEPIANDGTVFHLIERLWPAAAAMTSLQAVFLDKPDQRRT